MDNSTGGDDFSRTGNFFASAGTAANSAKTPRPAITRQKARDAGENQDQQHGLRSGGAFSIVHSFQNRLEAKHGGL